MGIAVAEGQEIHADALRTQPQNFGPDVAAILGQDAPDGVAIARALRSRAIFAEATHQVLDSVKVLVTPTTPVPAARIGQETVTYGGAEEPLLFAYVRCTFPCNAAHVPALSLPCGFTPTGLPIGLQVVGRSFEEATGLRVGHAYEQATDWHQRRRTACKKRPSIHEFPVIP